MFSTAVNIYQHKPEVINWRLVSKVLKHTDYYFPLISFLSFTNVTSVHDCLNDLQLKDFTWLYIIRRNRWWLSFTFGWTVPLIVWTGCCELQQSEWRWDVHVRDLQPPCWAHQALNLRVWNERRLNPTDASLSAADTMSAEQHSIQLHKDDVCSQEVIVWITNKTYSQVW